MQLELASHQDLLLWAAELVHQNLREHGGALGRWLRGVCAEPSRIALCECSVAEDPRQNIK
jgi:hypothetical protein